VDSSLVRVSVMSSTRRVDLVVPGAVPVAELMPELARSIGLLDARTAYAGYRLVTASGRVLAMDCGLTTQGVADGGLVTVTAGVDDGAPRSYDDVVEAMTEAVCRDLAAWDAAAGRRAALSAGVALLVLGAAALILQRASHVAAAAGVVVAVMTVLGAVTVSRAQGETHVAVTMAMVGSGYAAIAGSMLGRGVPVFGTPLAAGGGGALAAGSVAALGLCRGRSLLLPPVVLGALFLATGLMVRTSAHGAAVGLTSALVLVVMAGSVFPTLALGATDTGRERLLSTAGPTEDPARIELERIAADARIAHEILVGLAATVGVLLIVVAPLAVSLGLAGTVVSVLACGLVMLRIRHHHARAEVLVGLESGVLGLIATAVSVLWMHPAWRPAATAALVVTGTLLLVRSLLPRGTFVRWGRLVGVAESVALLGLPTALVIATGAFSSVQG
jgi:hypothetical protein